MPINILLEGRTSEGKAILIKIKRLFENPNHRTVVKIPDENAGKYAGS